MKKVGSGGVGEPEGRVALELPIINEDFKKQLADVFAKSG